MEFASGVTDFDTYIDASPTHRFAAELEWFAPHGVSSGNIDWDLGAVYSIDRIAVWNEDGIGVENLSVFTSNDSLFSSETFVGNFTLTNNPVGAFYNADVLSLTPTDARYVRFQIHSAYPDDENLLPVTASLGEIAFSVNAVPEPSVLWPVGVGLLGLSIVERRKRTSRRTGLRPNSHESGYGPLIYYS